MRNDPYILNIVELTIGLSHFIGFDQTGRRRMPHAGQELFNRPEPLCLLSLIELCFYFVPCIHELQFLDINLSTATLAEAREMQNLIVLINCNLHCWHWTYLSIDIAINVRILVNTKMGCRNLIAGHSISLEYTCHEQGHESSTTFNGNTKSATIKSDTAKLTM